MEGYCGPVIRAFVRFVQISGEEAVLYRRTQGEMEPLMDPPVLAGLERQRRGLIFLRGVRFPLRAVPPPIADAEDLPGISVGRFFQPQLSEAARARLQSGLVIVGLPHPDEMVRMVFASVHASGSVIAGREMPTRPGAPFIQLRREDAGLFYFGLLTDTAIPRSPGAAPTFAGMRIFTQAEWGRVLAEVPILAEPSRTLPKRVAKGGKDFRATDAPLVQEMKALVGTGAEPNAWQAALKVADRAAGSPTGTSRAQRLHKLYSETFRRERD